METYTDSLSPWFVTGFAERESSFTYSRSRRGLALYFSLAAAAGDAPLLKKIRESLGGVGTFYARRPGVCFRVTRIGELLRVVSHFDLHPLQGSKRAAFEVWREMVLLKSGPDPADADRLNLLAAGLSSLAPRNRARTRRPGAPL